MFISVKKPFLIIYPIFADSLLGAWKLSGGFVDYYEVLQISSNADQETISRIFRHLAKRYHPDNPKTADRDKFDQLVTAHDTLTDPQMRASYDVSYQKTARNTGAS